MFARHGKNRMHEAAVFDRDLEQHVFECVFMLILYGEHAAKVVMVMAEEHHVLGPIKSLEERR